jgi:CheY-like chemotaxis protein
VLTDILMPIMDGLEVIREIRRIDPLAKIIAISGGSPHRDWSPLSAAELLGADRVVPKPFDLGQVRQAISDCLEEGSGSAGAAAD